MKDRLIELLQKADKRCDDTKQCEDCIGFGKGSECVNYNIADYLLANGVIVPPCKVGDKLYEVIDDEELYITELTVTEVGTKVVFYSGYVPPKDDIHYHIPIDEIGKAYFFTQEEAEKALAERSENEHKTGNK